MVTPRGTGLTTESLQSRVLQSILFVARIVCQVETHDECLKSIGIPQLRGEVLRGVRTWNAAHTHSVKMSGGRIKILNKDGLVARQQALAQTLGVAAIGKRPHLYGEVSNRGTRAGN